MLDRWHTRLLLLACLGATSGVTAHADAASSAAPGVAPPPAEELVCRRVRETGTHISKKICRTRAQLDAEAAEGRQNMEAIDRNRRSPAGGDGSDMNSETPGSGA